MIPGLRRISWKLPMPLRPAHVLFLEALDGATDQLKDLAATPAFSSSPCASRVVQLCDILDELVTAAESYLLVARTDKKVVAHALSQYRVAAAQLRSGNADMDYAVRLVSCATEEMRVEIASSQLGT